MTPLRHLARSAGLAVLVALAACGDDGDGGEDGREQDQIRDSGTDDLDIDDLDTVDMDIDMDTLTAATAFGDVHAQRAEESFVAPLGEGQAIGFTWLDQVGATVDTGDNESDQLAVHVYNREDLALLTGKVDADGRASLEGHELNDFDVTVEATMGDDAVTGTVTFADGGEPVAYTAELATGTAGIYWAQGSDQTPDITCDWLVLDDDRQWGCVCHPPWINPCCFMLR